MTLISGPQALRGFLSGWGATAPPRLERRGRQKDLERWIFNRFLKARAVAGELEFPLKVEEDENPDFFLMTDGVRTGIEVTEAVCEAEQAAWTWEDKEAKASGEDLICSDDLMDPKRPEKTREIIKRSIVKKTKKCSPECDELLIYLNSTNAGFEKASTKLGWFGKIEHLPNSFHAIWVLSGDDLFELTSLRHVGSLAEPND